MYFQNTSSLHRKWSLQLRAGGPCLKQLLYNSVLHYFAVRNRQNTRIIVTVLLLLNTSSEPLNDSFWLHLETGCTYSIPQHPEHAAYQNSIHRATNTPSLPLLIWKRLCALIAVHLLVQEQQSKTVPILWHHCCPSGRNKNWSQQVVRVETQINLLRISWVTVTTRMLLTMLIQVLQPGSPQFLSGYLTSSSPGICC